MANYERGRNDRNQNWGRTDDRNQWRGDDRFGGYSGGGNQGDDWRRGHGAEGQREDWNRNVAFGQGGEDRSERDYRGGARSGGFENRGFGNDWSGDRGNRSDARTAGFNRGDDYRDRGGYGGQEGRGFRGSNEYGANYGRGEGGRDFWARASDEVSSWFGDDDAEHRRERDARQGDTGAQHHIGRGPKGYIRSDERIKEDVSDRLSDDRYVDASEIEVNVANREVTLSGTVDSRDAKRRAEDIAEHVSGVTHVTNNVRVKSQTSGSSWSNTGSAGSNIGSTTSGAGTTGATSTSATGLSTNRNL